MGIRRSIQEIMTGAVKAPQRSSNGFMSFHGKMSGAWHLKSPIVFSTIISESGYKSSLSTNGTYVVPKNGAGTYFVEILAFATNFGKLILMPHYMEVEPQSEHAQRYHLLKTYLTLKAGDVVYVSNFLESPLNWIDFKIYQ